MVTRDADKKARAILNEVLGPAKRKCKAKGSAVSRRRREIWDQQVAAIQELEALLCGLHGQCFKIGRRRIDLGQRTDIRWALHVGDDPHESPELEMCLGNVKQFSVSAGVTEEPLGLELDVHEIDDEDDPTSSFSLWAVRTSVVGNMTEDRPSFAIRRRRLPELLKASRHFVLFEDDEQRPDRIDAADLNDFWELWQWNEATAGLYSVNIIESIYRRRFYPAVKSALWRDFERVLGESWPKLHRLRSGAPSFSEVEERPHVLVRPSAIFRALCSDIVNYLKSPLARSHERTDCDLAAGTASIRKALKELEARTHREHAELIDQSDALDWGHRGEWFQREFGKRFQRN